jgi:hypothetical protein
LKDHQFQKVQIGFGVLMGELVRGGIKSEGGGMEEDARHVGFELEWTAMSLRRGGKYVWEQHRYSISLEAVFEFPLSNLPLPQNPTITADVGITELLCYSKDHSLYCFLF